MNPNSVVVNILINANHQSGMQGYNTLMIHIQNTARQTAQNSANSFSSIFGANFFAGLAERMVVSMSAGFTRIVGDAITASKQAESAFKGLESLGRNVGLPDGEAQKAVQNLDIVRHGLLDIRDAATATKNLLASGFSLPESINLIRAFGDTAAFGRQAALSFGYAISSATEGIKNQNSILVDNAGVTKNLSVIMKEMGKSEKDLMNVRSDASVRQALYNGLIKETMLQQGDANKMLDTTAGKLVQIDTAWIRLLRNLGDVITQSTLVKNGLGAIVSVLDFMGQNLGAVIMLSTSLGVLAGVVALTTTNFSALTIAQIANSAASTNLVKMIQTAALVMTDLRLVTALTAGEMALLGAGALGLVGIMAGVVYGLYSWHKAMTDFKRIDDEVLTSMVARQKVMRTEVDYLNTMRPSIDQVSSSNVQLRTIYNSLDPVTRTRIGLIKDETERIKELRAEVDKLANSNSKQLQAEAIGRVQALTSAMQQMAKARTVVGGLTADFQQVGNRRALPGQIFTQTANQNEAMGIAGMISQTNASMAEQEKIARKAAESIKSYSEITGMSIPTILNMTNANGQLGVTNEEIIRTIDNLTNAQARNTAGMGPQLSAIRLQINEYQKLTDVMDKVKGRQSIISGLSAQVAERYLNQGKPSGPYARPGDTRINQSPDQIFNDMLRQYPELQGIIKDQQIFDRVQKQINDRLSPKEPKKVKSELESLTDSLRKLRGEIASYQNLSSREFQLRFEKEELERVKRDFETIISLRRELGMPLNLPLPNQAEAARNEIESLERQKNLKEDIRAISLEIVDAEQKLTLARIASTAEVVSAQTRADTSYFEGLRERANAEQQLTADIITEVRRRTSAQNDSLRNIASLQAETYREFLQEQNDRDDDRIRKLTRLQLLAGGTISGNPLLPGSTAAPTASNSPVIQRMDTTNTLLTQIRDAVKPGGSGNVPGSGVSPTGSSDSTATVPLFADTPGMPSWMKSLPRNNSATQALPVIVMGGRPMLAPGQPLGTDQASQAGTVAPAAGTQTQTGISEERRSFLLAKSREVNQITLEYFKMFAQDKRLNDESMKSIEAHLNARKRLLEEGIKGIQRNAEGQDRLNQKTRVEITQVEELAVADRRLAELRSRTGNTTLELLNDINIQRQIELANIERQIIAQERLLKMGGRDKELEEAEFRERRNNELLQIGAAERELEESRRLNGDAEIQRARQISSITRERTDIENELAAIQNARATGPYNQSLREELAIQQELWAIDQANLDARTQIARIQVQMADKTVYHQDQANAKVLTHINQIKGLTDIYADAKINIVDGLFGGIDQLFTKLTGKFPILSKMLSEFLSGLTKLFLSPFLSRLLGGGNQAPGQSGGFGGFGGGGGNGGGGLNLGSIIQNILGGGGGGGFGAGGSYRTPGFNPNAGFGFGGGGMNFGGSLNPFSSFLSYGQQQSSSASMLSQMTNQQILRDIGLESGALGGNGVLTPGGSIGSAASGAFSLKGMGQAFGAIAPFLGMSLGSSLGGSSLGGSILGGIGGLAGGLALGIGTGAIGATGGIMGGLVAGLGGTLAATGILAAVAVPLLLGAYFLNRNKKRRQEEQIRTKILLDSKSQMQSIIDNLRSGNMDSSSALAQANTIRANYIQQVSQLTDKKTRRIALEVVRELDSMIEIVKSEGRRADYAAAQENAIVPTFSSGGYAGGVIGLAGGGMNSQFTGYGPSSVDYIPALLTGKEVILNHQNMMNLGGYSAMRRAGVRGMNMFPRSYDPQVRTNSSIGSTGSGLPVMYNIFAGSEQMANAIFEQVKAKGVAKKMKLAVYTGNDEGFLSTVEKGLAGEL